MSKKIDPLDSVIEALLASRQAELAKKVTNVLKTQKTAAADETAKKQLSEYGFDLSDSNEIVRVRDNKEMGVIITKKGGRLYAHSKSGNKLWSGPDAGKFVEKFWMVKKTAAPTPSNRRDAIQKDKSVYEDETEDGEWGVWGAETGFCYDIVSSKEEAKERANRINEEIQERGNYKFHTPKKAVSVDDPRTENTRGQLIELFVNRHKSKNKSAVDTKAVDLLYHAVDQAGHERAKADGTKKKEKGEEAHLHRNAKTKTASNELEIQAKAFIANLEDFDKKLKEKGKRLVRKEFGYEIGKKYARIFSIVTNSRSACAFIDETGQVKKADSWKAAGRTLGSKDAHDVIAYVAGPITSLEK